MRIFIFILHVKYFEKKTKKYIMFIRGKQQISVKQHISLNRI